MFYSKKLEKISRTIIYFNSLKYFAILALIFQIGCNLTVLIGYYNETIKNLEIVEQIGKLLKNKKTKPH